MDENEQIAHDVAELKEAFFGNDKTGEKGALEMVREMHQAWSAIIWLGKAMTAFVVFAAALGTAWMAFGHAIVRFFQRK